MITLSKKMHKLLIFLFVLFAAFDASAKYNDGPDASAIRLGTGNYSQDGYSKVYYICDTGSDTENDGLTPDTPFKTFSKARTLFNNLQPNEAIAFCRGGVFSITDKVAIANYNADKDNPVTVRDYQPAKGDTAAPKLIAVGDVQVFRLGNLNGLEGYIFKNLHLIHTYISPSETATAIFILYDHDYVHFDNIKIDNFHIGVQIAGTVTPDVVVADETLSDLTFTHNAVTGDTVTRGTGNWNATIRRGDALVVSGSASNDGVYRISSVAGNVITLTESIDGLWDVVNESSSPNVTVRIDTNDEDTSFLEFSNLLIVNNRYQGILGTLGRYNSIHDSVLDNNGFHHNTLDHNLYISGALYSEIYNNELYNNSHNLNTECDAVSFVGHGVWDHVKIYNNIITQQEDRTDAGCYGIAIDTGYSHFESFTNLEITGNTLVNMGMGIGCTACYDTLIDGNIIYTTTTTAGGVIAIAVPNRDPSYAGSQKTGNVTISNNKIYAKPGSVLNTGTGGIGIRVGTPTAADEIGIITVDSNEIDGAYTCIKNNSGGGATVSITNNTTTNCTAGEQP
jgi:hypothetical protein